MPYEKPDSEQFLDSRFYPSHKAPSGKHGKKKFVVLLIVILLGGIGFYAWNVFHDVSEETLYEEAVTEARAGQWKQVVSMTKEYMNGPEGKLKDLHMYGMTKVFIQNGQLAAAERALATIPDDFDDTFTADIKKLKNDIPEMKKEQQDKSGNAEDSQKGISGGMDDQMK